MGIKERKERERDERRSLILEAAIQIINEEGIDNLSVRKIAVKIEYSPAIIYHYFKNKDDIILQLIKSRYGSLVHAIQALAAIEDPEIRLAEFLRRYIAWALENAELYKTLMLSDSREILDNTSVLFEGASNQRPAFRLFFETVKELGNCGAGQAELTTQILWACTFGLIIRMIIEVTPIKQRKRLIEHHVLFSINAVKALDSHFRSST